MANQWYVELANEVEGPFSDQELKQLAKSGQLSPTTRIRLSANGQWALASAVRGLFPSAHQPAISNPTDQASDPWGDHDDEQGSQYAFAGFSHVPATQSPASDLPAKEFKKLGEERRILWFVSLICTVLGGACIFFGFVGAIVGSFMNLKEADVIYSLVMCWFVIGGGISLMIWGVGLRIICGTVDLGLYMAALLEDIRRQTYRPK